MGSINVERNTNTTMKIAKATMDENGRIIADGEVIDLISEMKEYFEGVVFDISITEKVKEKLTE